MKRVVICLDGTWNNNRSGTVLTNVAKLRRAIATRDDAGIEQSAHYVQGIASDEGEFAQFVKGALGFGSSDRVIKGFECLRDNYTLGDEIFLFGFSRGAFEARSLAAIVDLVGVPTANSDFSMDDAWDLYRKSPAQRSEADLAKLRANAHYPAKIKLVGVWDTVGNIGNPFISGGPIARLYEMHDTSLPASVESGLHALSIDEVRGPFRPTLWTKPKGSELPADQNVEQVWFAGSHADVGGGYRETQLSDISLLWMTERARQLAGLKFEDEHLRHSTRPDPLGPQHAAATGAIFKWSGYLPYVRLIKQETSGIQPLRRNLIGAWRAGKLPRNEESVNESIHDSVIKRFGERVARLGDGKSVTIAYRPRNLAVAMPDEATTLAIKGPEPVIDGRRQVKIFTVHGTFDHEAGWDNWEADDDTSREDGDRLFVNRLQGALRDKGIDFDHVDHTQYNWSGGNSHEERRVAAIGLKNFIEETLNGTDAGPYNGGIYVVGHSHGGTVARLAMNLWDKRNDYYEPLAGGGDKELKLDDDCPVCRRERYGEFGPNTAPRPDGVITFGSPFVRFEKRRSGLRTANIGVWVVRLIAFIALIVLIGVLWGTGEGQNALLKKTVEAKSLADTAKQSFGSSDWWSSFRTLWLLIWPTAFYWLFVSRLPKFVVSSVKRWIGKGFVMLSATMAVRAIQFAGLAVLALYYIAFFTGGWERAVAWFSFLGDDGRLAKYWIFAAIVLYWMVLVDYTARFLTWLDTEVMGLRDKLPQKYDPLEEKPVAYLSYHTAGDEAGVHLRIFGFLTWIIQTLSLSAAAAFAVGLVMVPVALIGGLFVIAGATAGLGGDKEGLTFLSCVANAWNNQPCAGLQPLVEFVDKLTYFPAKIWSFVFGLFGDTAVQSLSEMKNSQLTLVLLPLAILLSSLMLFIVFFPAVALALGIIYAIGISLRGSGVVFGSEQMTWTLANKISVARRANTNTKLRTHFITPEAWGKGEIAHCYYYKHEGVIQDVASHIANWSDHEPSRPMPLETWVPVVGRWLVVALMVLSIPLMSVSIAGGIANVEVKKDGKSTVGQTKPAELPKMKVRPPSKMPAPAAAKPEAGAAKSP